MRTNESLRSCDQGSFFQSSSLISCVLMSRFARFSKRFQVFDTQQGGRSITFGLKRDLGVGKRLAAPHLLLRQADALSRNRLLDRITKRVPDQDVALLNARCLLRRYGNQYVNEFTRGASQCSG